MQCTNLGSAYLSAETVLLSENALFNKLKERIAKNESLLPHPKNHGASSALSIALLPDPMPMEVRSRTLPSTVQKRKAELNIEKKEMKTIPTTSSSSAPMEVESESPLSDLCQVSSEPKKADPYNIGFFPFPPISRQQDNKQVQIKIVSNKPHRKPKKMLPGPYPYSRKKMRSSHGDD